MDNAACNLTDIHGDAYGIHSIAWVFIEWALFIQSNVG